LNTKFNAPKGFGQILDHTFSLSKDRFKDFFMILLILMGPVYLLQAILQAVSGTSLIRDVGTGNGWFEQMLSSLEESQTIDTGTLGADIGIIVVGFAGFLLFPVAEAAILFAMQHIQKNEDYQVRTVIRKAFSRFWPMVGSNVLFGLIAIGIIIVPLILAGVMGGIIGTSVHPLFGILTGILVFLGLAVGVAYLLTRWSFYFASVVLEKDSPGFTRSWRLTKKRTWTLIGLYLIFYIIISTISFVVEMTFGLALGNSVLLSLIVNFITIITTLIFSVGYGVMYFDLKVRHDADDLKELIEDYNQMDDSIR